MLRGALGQAVRWGWIAATRAASASPPKLRRREIKPPAIADTRASAGGCRAQDPDFGAAAPRARGDRRPPRRGVRAAVDRPRHERRYRSSIRRSVASVAGGTVVKDTKTHAARRIALDPDTLAVLAASPPTARATLARAVPGRASIPTRFVFSSSRDGSAPLHPDTVTERLPRVCDRLGLAGIRLHDLRHLHATQLLAAGVPVRTVSGRLGHANAATTLNVYAHFLEASDRQAADVIGGLLESPTRAGQRTLTRAPLAAGRDHARSATSANVDATARGRSLGHRAVDDRVVHPQSPRTPRGDHDLILLAVASGRNCSRMAQTASTTWYPTRKSEIASRPARRGLPALGGAVVGPARRLDIDHGELGSRRARRHAPRPVRRRGRRRHRSRRAPAPRSSCRQREQRLQARQLFA